MSHSPRFLLRLGTYPKCMMAYCSLISLINLMQIEDSFGTDFSERFNRRFYIYSIFIKTSSCTKNFSFNYLFKECLFLDPSSGWMLVFSARLSASLLLCLACLSTINKGRNCSNLPISDMGQSGGKDMRSN